MRIGDNVYNSICLYRSSNQFLEEFETFADNIEFNLDTIAKNKPFLIILFGEINAKLSKWYDNDSTSYEGNKIDDITSLFGMQ